MKGEQLELNMRIPARARIMQKPLVEMPVKKPSLKTKIKYVIFDFGGVMVREGLGVARRKYKEKTGIDIEKIWYSDIRPKWKALEKGEMADGDFWKALEQIVKQQDPRFDVGEFRKLMFKNQVYQQEVVKLILQLKARGYTTALLTNNVKEWIEEWDRKDPLNQYFDVIVSSHEVKEIKPEPRIYQITLERLGARPKECVFIDDKERNIETARRLGMKGIVFKTDNQMKKELNLLLNQQKPHRRKRKQFKVVCIDKFHDPGSEDGAPVEVGRYRTAREAVEAARKMTQDDMRYASDASIATVYYAYDKEGRYIDESLLGKHAGACLHIPRALRTIFRDRSDEANKRIQISFEKCYLNGDCLGFNASKKLAPVELERIRKNGGSRHSDYCPGYMWESGGTSSSLAFKYNKENDIIRALYKYVDDEGHHLDYFDGGSRETHRAYYDGTTGVLIRSITYLPMGVQRWLLKEFKSEDED